MVFYYICHHIFNIQVRRAHLLRDKTGGSHTRSGVHFQQIYLFSFGNDIVDADNSGSTENVVNGGSEFLYAVAQFIGDARRSYLVRLTVIFGFIVKNSLCDTTSVIGNTTDFSLVL